MIATQTIFSRIGGTLSGVDTALLKRDPFSSGVNEVYCVLYSNELYKLKLFMKQLDPLNYEKEGAFSKRN